MFFALKVYVPTKVLMSMLVKFLFLINNFSCLQQQKLFHGLKFYPMGGFESSYRGYLQELIVAAGGTILHRKPISSDQGALLSGSSTCLTFIIYSLELPDKCDLSKKDMILTSRRNEAEGLASSTGAKAVSNSWVLNSIAACKLQSFAE